MTVETPDELRDRGMSFFEDALVRADQLGLTITDLQDLWHLGMRLPWTSNLSEFSVDQHLAAWTGGTRDDALARIARLRMLGALPSDYLEAVAP